MIICLPFDWNRLIAFSNAKESIHISICWVAHQHTSTFADCAVLPLAAFILIAHLVREHMQKWRKINTASARSLHTHTWDMANGWMKCRYGYDVLRAHWWMKMHAHCTRSSLTAQSTHSFLPQYTSFGGIISTIQHPRYIRTLHSRTHITNLGDTR